MTVSEDAEADESTADKATDAPKRDIADLPPAARRALAEAEARRATADAAMAGRPREIDGRGGLEPDRFGDWEVKGIASDF